jgi:hypothetical protein
MSTCAQLVQSLRYFGFHFTQVPHTYSVSQPLSSHVSLSRNRHRRITEIDVYTQGFDISLFLWCQLVSNCFNHWGIFVWTHSHTRRRVWGCTPWRLVLTWRFDCDLLEKQNGINEVFLIHNADLRTMFFSEWSAFQPMFYCPKRFTLNACRRISREH